MTMILSASKGFSKEQVASVANAIATIARYVPGNNQAQKMAVARRVAQDIIRNHRAGGLLKNSNQSLRSYFEVEAVSTLKDAYRSAAAEDTTWVDTVKPSNPSYTDTGDKVTDTAKDVPPKISDYETRQQYIQRLVNSNYSLAAAQAAADIRFPPGPKVAGGTVRTSGNAQKGKYTAVEKIPPRGEIGSKWASNVQRVAIKSGSTEVPAWVATMNLENEYIRYNANNPNNLKSASTETVPIEYFGESIGDLLSRKAREREEHIQVKHRAAIKSAASKIPSWAYACGLSPEELER